VSVHRDLVGRGRSALRSFRHDDRGVTSIEYGLIASCIALAFIAIVILLGDDVGNMFETLSDSVQDFSEGGD